MTERVVRYLSDPSAFIDGCERMRLRLIYSGVLPSRRKDPSNEQWDKLAGPIQEIRRQFHPQLKEFWKTNQYLAKAKRPPETQHLSPVMHAKFYSDGSRDDDPSLVEHVANNFVENEYRFVPLVCKEWNLSCSIDIVFLRRDPPGSAVTHGDLDNRIKSLIDGLRKPCGKNELREHPKPEAGEDPFFVLLEDDKFITELRVETDTLLAPDSLLVPSNSQQNTSHLLISIEIKPYDISVFNLGFV